MGGCASKPKVSKDDPDVKAKAPEPELLKEDAVDETKVPQESAEPQHEIENTVDEDQTNKRRSLSLLFDKENDDTKVSEENEKTAVEETVKLESSKAEEKKLLDNEAAKQESPLIELEEKSPVQNEINKSAEEPTKLEKLIDENQSEPLKQEFVEAKDTFSVVETQNKEEPIQQEYGDAKERFSVETQNKEPIQQEPLPGISTIEQPEAGKPSGGPEKNGSKAEKSETLIEENMNTKVVPLQTEEKIVEALLTDASSVTVPKNITEEATANREEKNHNEVNHATKATDASSVIKP